MALELGIPLIVTLVTNCVHIRDLGAFVPGTCIVVSADLSRRVPESNKSTWIGIQVRVEMSAEDSEMSAEGRWRESSKDGIPWSGD